MSSSCTLSSSCTVYWKAASPPPALARVSDITSRMLHAAPVTTVETSTSMPRLSYGYSLRHIRLQPQSHTVAASVNIQLQPQSHAVAGRAAPVAAEDHDGGLRPDAPSARVDIILLQLQRLCELRRGSHELTPSDLGVGWVEGRGSWGVGRGGGKCVLRTAYCLLSTAYCVLLCVLLDTAYCWLRPAYCSPARHATDDTRSLGDA
eukprot:scaffold5350_cov75-Phaeocystis_antarctica.AAC.6